MNGSSFCILHNTFWIKSTNQQHPTTKQAAKQATNQPTHFQPLSKALVRRVPGPWSTAVVDNMNSSNCLGTVASGGSPVIGWWSKWWHSMDANGDSCTNWMTENLPCGQAKASDQFASDHSLVGLPSQDQKANWLIFIHGWYVTGWIIQLRVQPLQASLLHQLHSFKDSFPMIQPDTSTSKLHGGFSK